MQTRVLLVSLNKKIMLCNRESKAVYTTEYKGVDKLSVGGGVQPAMRALIIIFILAALVMHVCSSLAYA